MKNPIIRRRINQAILGYIIKNRCFFGSHLQFNVFSDAKNTAGQLGVATNEAANGGHLNREFNQGKIGRRAEWQTRWVCLVCMWMFFLK